MKQITDQRPSQKAGRFKSKKVIQRDPHVKTEEPQIKTRFSMLTSIPCNY